MIDWHDPHWPLVRSVTLSMIVNSIVLHSFIQVLVTLMKFQGQNSLQRMKLKVVVYEQTCRMVKMES